MSEIHFFANEADLSQLWPFLFSEIGVVAYPADEAPSCLGQRILLRPCRA
jgi:hypothetical protein